MLSGVMYGCDSKGKDTDKSQSGNSVSIAENSNEIPEEAKAKLQAALDAEPITIPADEWTVDTVCSAIYINGKQLSLPCTINDLGEGFEIMEDEEHELTYREDNRSAMGYLSYYGNEVGTFAILNCDSIEKIYDLSLAALNFECDNEVICPVAVNGVSIGSDAEFMKERLFFMEKSEYYGNEEDKSYYYGYNYNDFSVMCGVDKGEAYRLVLGFERNKKENN